MTLGNIPEAVMSFTLSGGVEKLIPISTFEHANSIADQIAIAIRDGRNVFAVHSYDNTYSIFLTLEQLLSIEVESLAEGEKYVTIPNNSNIH